MADASGFAKETRRTGRPSMRVGRDVESALVRRFAETRDYFSAGVAKWQTHPPSLRLRRDGGSI